ncbi:MAG: response regulator [Rhodanobacter sp.]
MPPNTPASPDAATRTPHLLVVDDDEEIARLLARYFTAHGFRVSSVGDGIEMRRLLAAESVDIVMLDLGLPGEDGLALTRYLREHWHGPVIIVTGRGDTVDRVVGLELGADDYVAKPFDLRELLARVRSVLRRAGDRAPPPNALAAAHPPRHAFDGYLLDTRSHTLSRSDGSDVPLTTGEFALLRVFVEHAGRVLSRDQLMTHLHGRDAGPFDRSVDVQIGRLRRKIEADPARPKIIKSIRGSGYLFVPRVLPA